MDEKEILFTDGFRDYGWVYGIGGRLGDKRSFREVDVSELGKKPNQTEIERMKAEISHELRKEAK